MKLGNFFYCRTLQPTEVRNLNSQNLIFLLRRLALLNIPMSWIVVFFSVSWFFKSQNFRLSKGPSLSYCKTLQLTKQCQHDNIPQMQVVGASSIRFFFYPPIIISSLQSWNCGAFGIF